MPREDLPYPVPLPGEPVRVAFVGQRTYFEACAQPHRTGALVPRFIDFRGGTEVGLLRDALRRSAPHAIVAFRPETLPPGAFEGVAAPVLGCLTEAPAGLDRNNVDRVLCVDPAVRPAAEALLPVWRTMPLPVDDRIYRTPRTSRRRPGLIFVGPSTEHRERLLGELKDEFDLRHYAHALMGAALRDALYAADVGVNLHAHASATAFEHGVLLYLAAGLLVLTEELEPRFGLEPGLDVVIVRDRDELSRRAHELRRMPDFYDRVRIRGHHSSRQFAASRVWPRVIADLFADLAAFGTERRVQA